MLSLRLKGRYSPQSTLSEDRVISSLFNVVIDTQSKIYPPSQHYQRTEWSLHCSMLSLRLKGRYTPPVNTSRGQRDLFTVQCCHWHSKADITPRSTLSEDRVFSSLFNVVIDTQRKIYPLFNTSRGQSDLFTVQCCHWHSKADIPLPPFNTIRGQSHLFTVQCCHWDSKADIPPINSSRGQSDLFTVQCCHWHSNRIYPPLSTLSEDRVISSLFNVVIDTQRQI